MRIENDRAIFKKGYPGIVPFLMEEYQGEISFEIYSGIKKTVEAFSKRFAGRYFSKEALTDIATSLDGYLEKHGYERDTVGTTLYYYQYEMKQGASLDRSLVTENTVMLTEALSDRLSGNKTTFSLRELLDKGLAAFVTVEDGKAVAIATVNECLNEGAASEVTVETAIAYRQKGYAVSCVTALCDYLLSQGCSVVYCCRNNHTKSNRVAKRVGFERVGRFYAVSAYRKHT